MKSITSFAPVALGLVLAACGSGAAAPAASTPAGSPAPASVAASKPAASAAGSAAASARPAGSPAASAGGSGAAIPSIPAGQKVKMATATGVPSVVFAPIWIAVDQGVFAKYGLDVSFTENLEGVKQATAIVAGDIQIGNVGGTEVLNSDVGGANMLAILQSTSSPVFEIHASPEYKKVEDLKGKVIAITQNGSSTDMAGRVLLKNHGLDPDKDVKLLNASNMPGIVAAMVSKQVQAGVVSPPTTLKATAAGFPKVASAVDEHVPLQNNLTATTKSFAGQHPEVVYAYLKAELESTKVLMTQPDIAVQEVAKHTDSDTQTAQAALDALKPALDPVGLIQEAGLKTVQDYGPNAQIKTMNLAGTYDNSFLQNLRASGFYDQIGLK
ncbi:MAG TPA: ABC transporter substrate-binding protein [Chloroflexota bacterium]|nr:ABC transporter substrate-binding protein [Chloroflexota bacterium]